MTEAYYYKKILMENNWDENAIKSKIIIIFIFNLFQMNINYKRFKRFKDGNESEEKITQKNERKHIQ